MNKKNKTMKKISILCLALGLFHISCNDHLDQIPQNDYTVATLFQREADLNSFLNTIYSQQKGFSLTNNYPNRGLDAMTPWSDDAFVNPKRNCCSGSELDDFATGGGKLGNIYNDTYGYIRQCNEFLTFAPQAEDSFDDPVLYRRYIAEARFHRAYHYHRLNTFFGDVPLVLDLIAPDDLQAKNTRLSVFEWINSELEDIADDLPESYTGVNVGRITKWAAQALRARHLLYAIGWHPDVSSLYTQAEPILKDIYDNSPHALEQGADGFQKLFTKAGAVSSESLWSHYYDGAVYGADNGGTGTSHGYSYFTLPRGAAGTAVNGNGSVRSQEGHFGATSNLVEAYQMSNGMDIRDVASGYDVSSPWDNRDPRLEVTILHAGEVLPRRLGSGTDDTYVLNPHPSKVMQVYDEDTDSFIDDPNRTNLDYVTTNNSHRSGYYYNKYNTEFDWGSDSKRGDIQYHFIRYAEVLLLYAEAALGNGNEALAISLVDEVRDRVGLPGITATGADAVLDAILLERRLELALEGPFRYYDIRRHRMGDEIFVGTLPGGGDKSIAYGIALGDGASPDASVLEGDLDDSKKSVIGTRVFDATYYYLPELPASAYERNVFLSLPPEEAEPWTSFFSE